MPPNNPHRILLTVIAALLFFTPACEREMDNPWDEKVTLDPNDWAPQNFQVEDVSITEKKLSWTYDDKNIEGFKLDRKKGDESWQVAYQVFAKTTRSFDDTIHLNPEINYHYKFYAFAGVNESAKKETLFPATIPPPQDLTITSNSATSITLNWSYNLSGHEGFKVERKQGTGSWELLTTLLGTSYTDDAFELNTDVSYHIAAYHGQFASDYVESSFNSQIPAPENLTITANSVSSVTLNWSYNFTGHEGFIIDRKIDNGNWEILADNLDPNQNNYDDNGLNLNDHTYNYRVYAYFDEFISSKLEESITFIFNCGEIFTDPRDGSIYETIQIGIQCWMKENLKWLPDVSPSADGSNSSAYHYVWGYEGNSVSEAKGTGIYQTYGVLYNWTAALNACPEGWYLPSNSEWTALTDYLGGSSVAGGKMKTTGTTHWNSPNTGATNSSNFSGLPGGFRDTNGSFGSVGSYGYWWSSTDYSWLPFYRYLHYNTSYASSYYYPSGFGFSVRCLRD